ncbi:serine/threonine-protein kinase Nek11 [Oreochromis niloticus]|uniref:serine/threonine-protein kinase Nek11 n=1 Tax=Oreochromis niloticus TaxID=8128 RepID=UPI000DF22734|nr:serine/threonine-protein kinase Nek11 [Oreochromis niloticus]
MTTTFMPMTMESFLLGGIPTITTKTVSVPYTIKSFERRTRPHAFLVFAVCRTSGVRKSAPVNYGGRNETLEDKMKTRKGKKLKVLKQIPLGDLRPDETVRATQEAQLLSQLHHPAVLTFYHSFLERDAFCIITEYCQDRDLDCKMEEVRRAGRSLPESQVIDWLIQLLLGLRYIHDRRYVHIQFNSRSVIRMMLLLFPGDFGVSCLLMRSCDLATTFTGTPYYMSPEVLRHQGYDCKSDIWALGCLLYQMCCLTHAFQAPNFLSVVMKIVEGDTPALPAAYSPDLNSVMRSMLQKQPTSRPTAAEMLKSRFMEENMQKMKDRFVFISSEGGKSDAAAIAKHMQVFIIISCLFLHRPADAQSALNGSWDVTVGSPADCLVFVLFSLRNLWLLLTRVNFTGMTESSFTFRLCSDCFKTIKQMKVHLQTLRDRSEVEKMTPRERMRLCKLQAADEKARRLRKLAEDKYEEVHTHRRELRSRHFEKVSVDVLNSCRTSLWLLDILLPLWWLLLLLYVCADIPEDPQAAEVYYNQDGFDSCSEDDEPASPAETLYLSDPQVSELEAMMKHMQEVLDEELSGPCVTVWVWRFPRRKWAADRCKRVKVSERLRTQEVIVVFRWTSSRLMKKSCRDSGSNSRMRCLLVSHRNSLEMLYLISISSNGN